MYLGIDVGSVSTNAVIIDEESRILGFSIVKSGFNHSEAIREAIGKACNESKVSSEIIRKIVGTGYGRRNVTGACKTVTEISCHAKGINLIEPSIRTVIDIGGQDSKVIKITPDGFVDSFTMNDKCAAGTGRFLEVMAHVMGVDVQELGQLSLCGKDRVRISSTCTVFAESEVISKIAEGHSKEDIINGIHRSIGERLIGMAEAVGLTSPVALTGGVAKNSGVAKVLSDYLKEALFVPPEPQIVGALGAAIYAKNEDCPSSPQGGNL